MTTGSAGAVLAALVSLAVAAPALAQDGSEDVPREIVALVEVSDEGREVAALRASVEEIDDFEVFGRDDRRIGDVEGVLMDRSGQIRAILVEAGGFLGVGERSLVMPLGDFTRVGDLLVLDLTREEVAALRRAGD